MPITSAVSVEKLLIEHISICVIMEYIGDANEAILLSYHPFLYKGR